MGGGGGGQRPYSQCYSLSNVSSSCITRKFVVRFVFYQKTGDSSGSNSCLKMNLCQPRSVILLEITPVKQSVRYIPAYINEIITAINR